MSSFVHIHVHTQYSILDGASNIEKLIAKAKNDGMPALAITDHGNMFGAKIFHKTALKAGIKPILGCEVYVAKNDLSEKKARDDRSGNHLILLAKNKTGYHNLIKLVSKAWVDGFYYHPRIDKNILREYHEGIIASTACIGGEIPQAILNHGIDAARPLIQEFKEIFGDDFYLELQRHKSGDPETDSDVYERQVIVNTALLELAKDYNVKCIASNDCHFINAEDAEAHDRLICLMTGKDLDDPERLRYTKQEYLKTTAEMSELYADHPEVIENTLEIAEKVEVYELDRSPVMPEFPIPEDFGTLENYQEKITPAMLHEELGEAYDRLGGGENFLKVLKIKLEADYLRKLVFIGAEKRYGNPLPEDVKERIDFELNTIKRMGFPGYFLIVQDFLNAAREMGVWVGPGRGSAAGSVVAYSINITDIDPLKYNLLFERFLNPDRISMPDIDIDFDEDGREEVLKWVVDKYGKDRVAHIITFGKMAAKMAIRDIARVQKLSLPEADRLAKMVPERPGMNLEKAYKEVKELRNERNSENPLIAETLKYAETLEGSVRQTGLHACGIIISKDTLTEYIPVCTSKDSELLVTQYDGKHIEDVGMLKMDFLGLKTLSILKDAVENIWNSKKIKVDISSIPLEDEKTYQLYSNGETTGLFQFESAGMKKYLRELKPNRFEDLIAMNALYRPGPMEYIPNFIARKHGREPIIYDLAEMEGVLKETYGVTVYQEQVMLLSRKLAGFSRGDADKLRKAMGKKIDEVMAQMKTKFVEGCKKNNFDEEKVEKIWNDWAAFAKYAFNKSHSTCYSYVSYQTAYLKAHYPAEFMAAVLSRNLTDIKKITIFMDECKRMGITVLGPDVNESRIRFNVNKQGNIRFGLGAIKGVGEAAAQNIIDEREKNGSFSDIYDFVQRINLQAVNKKSLENLALAGALDNLGGIKRHQYLGTENNEESNFIETLIRFGNKMQAEKNTLQINLFGDTNDATIVRPNPPDVPEWSDMQRLSYEKELTGIYLSAHPLDNFRLEMNNFCNCTLTDLKNPDKLKGKKVMVGGIVSATRTALTKTGNPFGSIDLEDYTESHRFMFFGKDYVEYNKYFQNGLFLFIKGQFRNRSYGNTDELEFKIEQIELLPELRKRIKSIQFKIALEDIQKDLIDRIYIMSQNNKGKATLQFQIYDKAERIRLNLFSRKIMIDVNNKVLNELEQWEDVEYSVSI